MPPNDAAGFPASGATADRTEKRMTVRPSSAALQPNVGALLHDVTRLMRRHFDRRARQTGLAITRQQARVLLCIARNEGDSQATVAASLDIEPIALVRMLDRLHEEGLVERRPHPTDRRVRRLWLTPQGWRVVDRILEINAAVRAEACAGLAPEAQAALRKALGLMKENLALAEETAAVADPAAHHDSRAAE